MTFGSGGALPVTPVRVVTLSKASAKISAFSGAPWVCRGVTRVIDSSYVKKLTYEGLELGRVRHRLYVGTATAGCVCRGLWAQVVAWGLQRSWERQMGFGVGSHGQNL